MMMSLGTKAKSGLVLLTGATGFIGRSFLKCLTDNEPAFRILALGKPGDLRKGLPQKATPNVEWDEVDLSDPDSIRQIPRNFSYVVHLAAYVPRLREDYDSPLNWRVNVEGMRNLMQVCFNNQNLKRFVLGSSISVYGEHDGTLKENDACLPNNAYALSKWVSELMVEKFCDGQGISYAILRYASVYGEGQNPNTVLPLFLEKAKRGEPIKLFDEGNRYQDFVHVRDVAQANVLALQSRQSGVFNVGSGQATSMKNLAVNILKKHGGASGRIVCTLEKDRGKSQVMDISRARRNLNYRPFFNLDRGLECYDSPAKVS
ncbi:MAG: NAD(P)-dependent oxidoreductase, partial [Candidatus Omnitrophica bacterium]|nr:NAD(P)-dependent oxidoreductase [Candidatus Omnitrophota bacterium]